MKIDKDSYYETMFENSLIKQQQQYDRYKRNVIEDCKSEIRFTLSRLIQGAFLEVGGSEHKIILEELLKEIN